MKLSYYQIRRNRVGFGWLLIVLAVTAWSAEIGQAQPQRRRRMEAAAFRPHDGGIRRGQP